MPESTSVVSVGSAASTVAGGNGGSGETPPVVSVGSAASTVAGGNGGSGETPSAVRADSVASRVARGNGRSDADKSFGFLNGTSWTLFATVATVFYVVYQKASAAIRHESGLPSDYYTVTLVFLIGFLLITFVLALFIQCNENADIKVICFLVINVIFIFSLSLAIWVCQYPKGYIPAGVFLGVSTLLLLILWGWKFEKPQFLHALLSCGHAPNLHGNQREIQIERYNVLKGSPVVVYGLITVILYEVFDHANADKDIFHGHVIASFVILIVATVVGFYLLLFTQLYDRAGDIMLAIWAFIALIVILLFSLGYAIFICLYPRGLVAGMIIFFGCTGLLFIVWPIICSEPECLQTCLQEVKTWPGKAKAWFDQALGYVVGNPG